MGKSAVSRLDVGRSVLLCVWLCSGCFSLCVRVSLSRTRSLQEQHRGGVRGGEGGGGWWDDKKDGRKRRACVGARRRMQARGSNTRGAMRVLGGGETEGGGEWGVGWWEVAPPRAARASAAGRCGEKVKFRG